MAGVSNVQLLWKMRAIRRVRKEVRGRQCGHHLGARWYVSLTTQLFLFSYIWSRGLRRASEENLSAFIATSGNILYSYTKKGRRWFFYVYTHTYIFFLRISIRCDAAFVHSAVRYVLYRHNITEHVSLHRRVKRILYTGLYSAILFFRYYDLIFFFRDNEKKFDGFFFHCLLATSSYPVCPENLYAFITLYKREIETIDYIWKNRFNDVLYSLCFAFLCWKFYFS